MSAQFTDDDLGKRVENANGEEIGAVTAIEDDVAHVKPKAGLVDSIKAALGWTRETETAPVPDEAIDEITDDVVRLEAEPLEAGERTADEPDRTDEGPDESAPESRIESEADPAGDSDGDRLGGAGREATDAAANPTEASATDSAALEDELNRGTAVDPSAETDEPDAAEPDRPSETRPSAARGERDEPADVGNPTDAEATGVIDEWPDEALESERDPDASETGDETASDDSEATSPEAADETASTDLADELDRGRDLESPDDAGDTSERTPETDASDELDRGSDLESVAEPIEETDAEEPDLAAELDQGADLESAESSSSGAPDRDATDRPTEAMDLADELDRGGDLESAAETEREVDAETASDPAARGPVPEPGGEPESAVDRAVDAADPRPMEPASRGALEPEPTPDRHADEPGAAAEGDAEDRSRRQRGGAGSPFGAMLSAQRTALEQSQQLFESGLAAQRSANRMAFGVLDGQLALQRQGLELLVTAATAPLRAADAMASGRRDGRRFERRLELVDGIDSMYRERLADAGITSLDDLALADAGTVAEAAEVTEKRAAGWIEQAAA